MIKNRNIDRRAEIASTKIRTTIVEKDADYTLIDATTSDPGDMGKTFICTKGSNVDFYLPLPSAENSGYTVTFLQTTDFTVTIRVVGDNVDCIVGLDDAGADIAVFATTNELIGASVTFLSNGSKWFTLYNRGTVAMSG